MSHLEEILGAPATIDSLCKDIINHYEENRQFELTGKAMIVAYSRPIAMSIYHRILELRPNWTDKVKVVMTGSNKDPEEWHDIIGNKQYKKELAKKFKDNNDPMKIAIVVDMWLTGFDVPSLATMYVYKPMSGHNLMQAIARVNRVFNDKAGGLVVDYIGIAKALKQAMHDYTVRDQKKFGNPDIKKLLLLSFKRNWKFAEISSTVLIIANSNPAQITIVHKLSKVESTSSWTVIRMIKCNYSKRNHPYYIVQSHYAVACLMSNNAMKQLF